MFSVVFVLALFGFAWARFFATTRKRRAQKKNAFYTKSRGFIKGAWELARSRPLFECSYATAHSPVIDCALLDSHFHRNCSHCQPKGGGAGAPPRQHNVLQVGCPPKPECLQTQRVSRCSRPGPARPGGASGPSQMQHSQWSPVQLLRGLGCPPHSQAAATTAIWAAAISSTTRQAMREARRGVDIVCGC